MPGRQRARAAGPPIGRHWFTGDFGSNSSAITCLICCSLRMPRCPALGILVHALYAREFQILAHVYSMMGLAAGLFGSVTPRSLP